MTHDSQWVVDYVFSLLLQFTRSLVTLAVFRDGAQFMVFTPASSFRSAWDFFLRSRNSSEQKARAQGIQKVITSFMFVASLYFFSDIMPQLTIFCKTLQAVDISLEGVLAAYELTRATLHAYTSPALIVRPSCDVSWPRAWLGAC